MDPVHESGPWTRSKEGVHGPLVHVLSSPVCAESGGKLIKLSDCKNSIDDSLRKLNVLSHFQGQLLEYDLILNRSGLAHDLSFDQLERLWICEKHRNDMGKYWRPRQTCQYPLHRPGPKKKLRTRNAVHASMSREINLIFGKNVPIGSLGIIYILPRLPFV